MKFLTQGIVFSEIPDEITLELGISNCPFRCEGCHSPFLQKDVGTELTLEILKELIENNNGISCILFSGGSPKEVEEACHYISIFYPNIKTAWYTGMETIPIPWSIRQKVENTVRHLQIRSSGISLLTLKLLLRNTPKLMANVTW